jgi:hypothetical protein
LFKKPPAASRSSYVSETNVVAKVTGSTINQTACIAQAKPVEINRTFVFHPFLETTPKAIANKTKLIVSLRSEVTPLGVKLKVAVLSIHS